MAYIEIKRQQEDQITLNIRDGVYFNYISYLDGFFKASLCLLEELLCVRDTNLLFPLIFSVSHYMEIWIKVLILFFDDTKTIKELKVDKHTTIKIIEKYKEQLIQRGVNNNILDEIINTYSYFLSFSKNNEKSLSEVMRFPTDYKTRNVIVNYDAIDEACSENYSTLKSAIFKLFASTNVITKEYFRSVFTSMIENIEVKANDKL